MFLSKFLKLYKSLLGFSWRIIINFLWRERIIDMEQESDNVEAEPINKPGIEVVQKTVGILEDFSLYSKFGEAMMTSLKKFNFNVEKECF